MKEEEKAFIKKLELLRDTMLIDGDDYVLFYGRALRNLLKVYKKLKKDQ